MQGGKELQSITTSNAYRLAYETIRKEILIGKLPGGSKLVEERLAENIGVSRTPIREAIRRLEQEGLIKNKRVYKPTKSDIINTFELRMLIECYAVRLAAKNMSFEKLNELKQAVENSRTFSIDENVNANKHFHDLIVSECNNPIMIAEANKMNAIIYLFNCTFFKNNRPHLYEEHKEIYHAIKERDEELAVSLLQKHLEVDLQFILTFKGEF